MSRISSLADLNKKEDGEGDGDEYYSGGNDNRGGGSGLNVIDPNSDMDRLEGVKYSPYHSSEANSQISTRSAQKD